MYDADVFNVMDGWLHSQCTSTPNIRTRTPISICLFASLALSHTLFFGKSIFVGFHGQSNGGLAWQRFNGKMPIYAPRAYGDGVYLYIIVWTKCKYWLNSKLWKMLNWMKDKFYSTQKQWDEGKKHTIFVFFISFASCHGWLTLRKLLLLLRIGLIYFSFFSIETKVISTFNGTLHTHSLSLSSPECIPLDTIR